MEEEIVIMESLVESYMTSENIKNLVDLLKKVSYFCFFLDCGVLLGLESPRVSNLSKKDPKYNG